MVTIPRTLWVIPLSAILLMAADPDWKNKPIQSWTEQDALQILTHSPWAKTVNGEIRRLETEFERREGGQMGQAHGVGYDGIDANRRPGANSAAPNGQTVRLQLRWESALPVRAAELKSHVVEPPTLPGEGYRIAVYGVPNADVKGDPKGLGDPLKKQAALKREGKKDVRPSAVEVFQREDGLAIVYLFPPSAEITKYDKLIEFDAQIGRIVITQSFDLGEMQFQGKLEL